MLRLARVTNDVSRSLWRALGSYHLWLHSTFPPIKTRVSRSMAQLLPSKNLSMSLLLRRALLWRHWRSMRLVGYDLWGVYCGLTSMRPRSMTIRMTRDLSPLIFGILTLLMILFGLLPLLLQDHLSALVFTYHIHMLLIPIIVLTFAVILECSSRIMLPWIPRIPWQFSWISQIPSILNISSVPRWFTVARYASVVTNVERAFHRRSGV